MNELLNDATTYKLDTQLGQKLIADLDKATFGAFSATISKELNALSDPKHYNSVGNDDGAAHEMLLMCASLVAQFNERYPVPPTREMRAINPAILMNIIANTMAFAIHLDESWKRDENNEIRKGAPQGTDEKTVRVVHFMARNDLHEGFTKSMAKVSYELGGQVILKYLEALK